MFYNLAQLRNSFTSLYNLLKLFGLLSALFLSANQYFTRINDYMSIIGLLSLVNVFYDFGNRAFQNKAKFINRVCCNCFVVLDSMDGVCRHAVLVNEVIRSKTSVSHCFP